MATKTALVYAGAGVQGGAIALALADAGYVVRALTRTGELGRLGSSEAVCAVRGDAQSAADVAVAIRGVDLVALTLPLGSDEAAQRIADIAIRTARDASVRKVVFNTSSRIPSEATKVGGFEVRRGVEDALRHSGLDWTSIRPTSYMENFLIPWTLHEIAGGGELHYPLPAEYRNSWIAARDLGASVAEAAVRPDLSGRCVDINGPEPLEGRRLAEVFGLALGRTVRYIYVEPKDYQARLNEKFRTTSTSLQDYYEYIIEHPATMRPVPMPLAVAPTYLTHWLASHARELRAATGGAIPVYKDQP